MWHSIMCPALLNISVLPDAKATGFAVPGTYLIAMRQVASHVTVPNQS